VLSDGEKLKTSFGSLFIIFGQRFFQQIKDQFQILDLCLLSPTAAGSGGDCPAAGWSDQSAG
jgi:hypothetical protein